MESTELKNKILNLIASSSFDLAIQLVREGLTMNLFDSTLYYYMGLIYKHRNNYNCAYLCFENSLQNAKNEAEKNEALLEINVLKESGSVAVNNYSIIILTFNNLKDTIECIKSIRKYNTLNNYEIIVIDNNSSDSTPEWLKSQKDIKYILNSDNKGFPAGCNQGINITDKNNDIFLLNNDTITMPNSIFNLRMGLYSGNDIGSASPVSNHAPRQTIRDKFDSISAYLNYSLKNNIPNDDQYDYRLTLVGFALFFKREVLNKVGLLDERFTPGNFEDTDISLRILKSGYKNILCKDSFIYHYGSKSFGRDTQKYHDILNINNGKFQDKWRFSSQKYLSLPNDALQLIDEPTEAHLNILEIGCGCGATLLEIKNIYPYSNVYGIELNYDAAKVARSFANITVGDIETVHINYKESYFDYIIFADTLNSLKTPLKTLENIKKYLKPNGCIVGSIPNALNFTFLKKLINGNCYYDNDGNFNNEHLNFLTYKDISRIFKDAGYNNVFITSIANMPDNMEDMDFINKICELSNYQNIQEELINCKYYVKAHEATLTNDELEKKYVTENEINIIVKELDKNYTNIIYLDELIRLMACEDVTPDDIINAVENKIIFQGKILNNIAVKCLDNNLKDYALTFLEKASSLEPRNIDVIYNLGSYLASNGKYKLALEKLNSLYLTNKSIEDLKVSISNHLSIL